MIVKGLSTVFKTLEGENFKLPVQVEVKKDERDDKGVLLFKKGSIKTIMKDLTLKDAMTNVLISTYQINCTFCGRAGVNEEIAGEEKARRSYLAIEIYKAKNEIELEVDDVKLIKDRIGKIYSSALVVGQAWELLDPKKKEKK